MEETIKSFLGNINGNYVSNPLAFNIRNYINSQGNISFKNFITREKYAQMNDHFFSYYSKRPLRKIPC